MACRAGLLHISSTLTSIVNSSALYNVKDFYRLLCNFYIHRRIYTTADAIINFTNESSVKNTDINQNIKNNVSPVLKKLNEIIKYEESNTNLSKNTLNELVSSALLSKNISDIKYYTNYCINNEKIPPHETMLKLFEYFADGGNIAVVKSLQKLYELKSLKISKCNYNFNHYLARAHWVKGNVEEAFLIFYNVYENNKNLKVPLLIMLKHFIKEIVANSSEASIVIAKKYTLKFGQEFNQWSPLMNFWENCWLSEWFRDQQLADELFDKYQSLRERLSDRIPIISSNALKNNCENSVRNLLELLLKYEMLHQYTLVIGTLFDYKYRCDDIDACSEIMKNCKSLNIKLTDIHNEKYLFMKITTDKTKFKPKPFKKTTIPVQEFKYKF